jgi:hypothetical protein
MENLATFTLQSTWYIIDRHKKSGFVYALKQIKRKGMDEIL